MPNVRTWVCYRSRWPLGLPTEADRLGTVEAANRAAARELATAQWPNAGLLVIQLLGSVMVAMDDTPVREQPDYQMIGRVNKARRKG